MLVLDGVAAITGRSFWNVYFKMVHGCGAGDRDGCGCDGRRPSQGASRLHAVALPIEGRQVQPEEQRLPGDRRGVPQGRWFPGKPIRRGI